MFSTELVNLFSTTAFCVLSCLLFRCIMLVSLLLGVSCAQVEVTKAIAHPAIIVFAKHVLRCGNVNFQCGLTSRCAWKRMSKQLLGAPKLSSWSLLIL
uniref:Uncharacterized protein n=1 Tax=Physcomitrium patens TaxID=3218 RepID=A0A2K1IHE6_PHYPA|nr:hypothetical protein PHYPA_029294 [Physcomitrium patens]